MSVSRKIWMLTSIFYPGTGGGERQAQHLSREMIKQGKSVEVLTRRHGVPELKGVSSREIVDTIPVTRVYTEGSTRTASALYMLGGLWHLIRHGRGAIYHAHGEGTPAWLAIIAARLLGGRSLVKLRSGRQVYERIYASGLGRRQFLAQMRFADRIIAVNSQVVDYLRGLGVPDKRIIFIPNGVDTSQFNIVSPGDKAAIRQKISLPLDKTVVLYVGRLHHVKGVDVLIGAWAQLPEAIRNRTYLVIVGHGSDHEKLQALIHALGIGDSAVMTGIQRNVLDYYHAADVFALPSRSEGLSNALVEAMACGLPAIASTVGGALDLIREGENGFLVEPENEGQLAEKLATVISLDSDQRLQIGLRAREAVVAHTDLSIILEKLQAAYLELS